MDLSTLLWEDIQIKVVQMSMKTPAHNLDKKYVTLKLGISTVLFHW